MTANQPDLPQLYQQLNICTGTDDYVRSRKLADQILRRDPTQWDAFYTKIICIINEGNFDAIFRHLSTANKFPNKSNQITLIRAYSLYRQNKHKEALAALSESPPNDCVSELRAQILYKMENYTQAFEIYDKELFNGDPEIHAERLVNKLAAISLSGSQTTQSFTKLNTKELNSYEQLYNYSTLMLAMGEYPIALDCLERAESIARNQLTGDPDYSQEDLDEDLSSIRVQKAFTLQSLGDIKSAAKLYNMVLKQRLSDLAVNAIVCNNYISINKDKDLFDSKKKMKISSSENAFKKLTSRQKNIVSYNKCLLAVNTNQMEQANTYFKQMVSISGSESDELLPLLELSMKHKNGSLKASKNDMLKLAKENTNSISLIMSLAQVALITKHFELACEILISCKPLCYMPGIVSVLIGIYSKIKCKDKIEQSLLNAIEYWYTQIESDTRAKQFLKPLVCHYSHIKLQEGSITMATSLLEKYHEFFKGDNVYSHLLIQAYTGTDISKAEEVINQLPKPKFEKFDIDELEKITTLRQVVSKKTVPVKPGADQKKIISSTKIHKKKKKGKLPKNFNPDNPASIDTERWLPLKERSYYTKKFKRRGLISHRHIQKGGATASKAAPANISGEGESETKVSQAFKKSKPKKAKKGKRW